MSIFKGAGVAITTPFLANGEVDYDTFKEQIEYQVNNGTDAIIVCGTTGEGSTLTDEEHKECIRFCVERVAGKKPVIAGTGSNDTAYALDLTKYACDVGVDGVLIVTPYYNKSISQLYAFAFKYSDKHREEISKFTKFDELEAYLRQQNLLPEFVRFAAPHLGNPSSDVLKKSGDDLNRLLIAYIMRQCKDENYFYQEFNSSDKTYQKGLEVLRNQLK